MRLDLLLKTSRLVKRRSIARDMCDAGMVQINGREAKPAREVKQGDVITLRFASRMIQVEITDALAVLPHGRASCDTLYRVISETRLHREKDL